MFSSEIIISIIIFDFVFSLLSSPFQSTDILIHVIFVIRRVLFLNIILNYNSMIDTNYIIYATGFLYRWIEHIERIILVYFIRYILGYF